MLKRCFVFQSLQERKHRKALAEAAALFQLIQIDLKIRIRKMLLFFLPLQRRDGVAVHINYSHISTRFPDPACCGSQSGKMPPEP